MARSKIILNGEVAMTVQDTTAVESDVTQGKYFYRADGVRVEGTNNSVSGNPETFINNSIEELNTITNAIALKFNPSSTSLDFTGVNTSEITNMEGMFQQFFELTSLNLSSFNTSNVTNMSNMFAQCSLLTSLDLSSFNTSNVIDMGYMFSYCTNLTSLDLSSFDTSNVGDMRYMFRGCENLTNLDIRNFQFGTLVSVNNMFTNVPSNCVITVKNQIAKDFLINNASTMKLVLTDMNTQIVIAGN